MPVIPLPPPRRPETELPLPPLVDYPIPPQIHFERRHVSHVAQAQPEYPSYAHLPAPAPIVAGPPSVRPCHNCQLSVSAKARFCRRCGSAQAA
jgi:hypothetical protein